MTHSCWWEKSSNTHCDFRSGCGSETKVVSQRSGGSPRVQLESSLGPRAQLDTSVHREVRLYSALSPFALSSRRVGGERGSPRRSFHSWLSRRSVEILWEPGGATTAYLSINYPLLRPCSTPGPRRKNAPERKNLLGKHPPHRVTITCGGRTDACRCRRKSPAYGPRLW